MDGGYHQVCVSMSQQFLQSSRLHDRNDLSSVVSEGGHWCICAWAWASAASRDPVSMEGIVIDCERTNGRLRQVYELHIREGTDLRSPSGAYYKAKNALEALNRKCPPATSNESRPIHSAVEANRVAHQSPTSEEAADMLASGESLDSSVDEDSDRSDNISSNNGALSLGLQVVGGAVLLSSLFAFWRWSRQCFAGLHSAKTPTFRAPGAMKVGKDSATESEEDVRALGA